MEPVSDPGPSPRFPAAPAASGAGGAGGACGSERERKSGSGLGRMGRGGATGGRVIGRQRMKESRPVQRGKPAEHENLKWKG